ncbi:MAG: hypothetical protein N4A47_04010 [Clostridia bacterium]|jgi:hypothetical protein|nr:hypothetical protein [Clostridia bacterium]
MILLDESYSYEEVKQFDHERKDRTTEVADGIKLVEKVEFEVDGDKIVVQTFRGTNYFGYRGFSSDRSIEEKRIYKNDRLIKLELQGSDESKTRRKRKEERYYIEDTKDKELTREDYIGRLTQRGFDTDESYISFVSLDSKYCHAYPELTKHNAVFNSLTRPVLNKDNEVIGEISAYTSRHGVLDKNMSIDMHVILKGNIHEATLNGIEDNYIEGMSMKGKRISVKKDAKSKRNELYTLEGVSEKKGLLKSIENEVMGKATDEPVRVLNICDTEGYKYDMLLEQVIEDSLDMDI